MAKYPCSLGSPLFGLLDPEQVGIPVHEPHELHPGREVPLGSSMTVPVSAAWVLPHAVHAQRHRPDGVEESRLLCSWRYQGHHGSDLRASAASLNVPRPTSPWHLLAATAEEGPANRASENSSTMPTQRFSRRGMSYHPVRQRARPSLCLTTFWADGPAGDFVFGNTIVAPRDDRLRSHIALSAYWLTIQW